MTKILFNLYGEQCLSEVGEGGGVTIDAEILWDERDDGEMPSIVLGKMIREDDQLVELEEFIPSHVEAVGAREARKLSLVSKRYLITTDWYIIREMDSGVPCPTDIKEARATARANIIS